MNLKNTLSADARVNREVSLYFEKLRTKNRGTVRAHSMQDTSRLTVLFNHALKHNHLTDTQRTRITKWLAGDRV